MQHRAEADEEGQVCYCLREMLGTSCALCYNAEQTEFPFRQERGTAKPKIFVSHSSLDTEFASKLVSDLNAAGAQAWMDVNDLGAGGFQSGIDEALADCRWFLLVLTRNALASEWVRQEVYAANRLKNQGNIVDLIFIKAADVSYPDLPPTWGIFNILDAISDYNGALERVLKAVGLPSAPSTLLSRLATAMDAHVIRDEPGQVSISLESNWLSKCHALVSIVVEAVHTGSMVPVAG